MSDEATTRRVPAPVLPEERPPTRSRWPAGVSLLALLWIAAALLAIAAAGPNTLPGDVPLERSVQAGDIAPARWLAALGNHVFGALGPGIALAAVAVAWLLWRRRPRLAALVIGAMLCRTLGRLLKAWDASPRPTAAVVRVQEHAHDPGFPSGHMLGATLLFGALALVAWRLPWPRRARAVVVGGCLLAIVITGFGRIFVGAHWPSDVLGGLLFGAALLATLTIVFRLGPPPSTPRPPV